MCLYFSPHRQNDYGQIGIGSNENVTVPRFVECLVHVSKVTCGANHNLALTGTEMHCAMQLYITFKIFSSLDKQLKCLIVHMLCIPYTTSPFFFNVLPHTRSESYQWPFRPSWFKPVRFISYNPPVQRVDVTSLELSLCASKFTYFTQFYANIRAPQALDQHITWERDKEGERGRERIWPWLLIHNSHCLLHTFQNSFRLWR